MGHLEKPAPDILTTATELGGLYIKAGAIKFGRWAVQIIDAVGEAVRPYLKPVYLDMRNMPGMEGVRDQMETEAQLDEPGYVDRAIQEAQGRRTEQQTGTGHPADMGGEPAAGGEGAEEGGAQGSLPFDSRRREDLAALDQLFQEAGTYTRTGEYMNLLRFICRFPRYSPFNRFLLYVQNPGVQYVATPSQWRERFGRWIKEGARPLVILCPGGPVLFVYDITDTEGDPVPDGLLNPFDANGRLPARTWGRTLANCPRDLIDVVEIGMHPNSAGYIRPAKPRETVMVTVGKARDGKPVLEPRRAFARLVLNKSQQRPAQYATLAHELAHLYCGHLGTPNEEWWPDRDSLGEHEREFEAESVAYLVCRHIGIDTRSVLYLAGYCREHSRVPKISLNCVLTVAGKIERMGRETLKPRKKG